LESRAADVQVLEAESKFHDASTVTPETFHPRHVPRLQEQQMHFDVQKYEDIHVADEQVPLREMLRRAQVPIDGHVADDLSGKRDNFSKFKATVLTLLQVGKRNPHIPGLASPTQFEEAGYIQLMREMQQSRLASEKRNEQILHDWRSLGAKQAELVGELAMWADQKSFREGRLLPQEELREKAGELGLNEDAWQQYGEISRYFKDRLEDMENAMADRILRTVDDTIRQETLLNELREDMNALRRRNFFPSGRFGKHVVIVRAKEGGTFEGQTFLSPRRS
jgi:hypothetical protein